MISVNFAEKLDGEGEYFLSEPIKIKGLEIRPSKDELSTISFSKLIELKIAPGHLLYFPANSDRAFLLLRAGEFVDKDWIDRYRDKGLSTFYVYNIINEELINEGKLLFEKLKNAQLEEEHYVARNLILKWFNDYYWNGSKDCSTLDFVMTCYKTFSRFEEKTVNTLKDTSLILYNHAHQVASFSTILALVMGYMDYEFLSDIYHGSFLLDYGLMGDKFTYNVAKACEQESEMPFAGHTYIKQRVAKGPEYQTYLNHAELGYLLASRDCKDVAYSLDIFSLIRKHHEMGDGRGIPFKLHRGVIAEWESIPLFMDHAVPMNCDEYKLGDGSGILKKYINDLVAKESANLLPSSRLVSRIRAFFDTEVTNLITEVQENLKEEKEAAEQENPPETEKIGA